MRQRWQEDPELNRPSPSPELVRVGPRLNCLVSFFYLFLVMSASFSSLASSSSAWP
ncbi:hypothetical protein FISHEDRAFT_72016 [Fistulina hepatica ATCC 64428]|uniref:Uncharacterized protein n=1 Tax=Fistulina hepatica ATCC 64428 TaxID=1128425 RepID=A0A0D7AFE1_9AGAR|nr:hypothetical protein FISHEDRAFT_72016 [Fistulina hepatica ATCC 64428]